MIFSQAKFPISERLEIGLLLALVGGFLDAYTYLCYDEVFANAQSGNMILLAIALINGEFSNTIDYLVPILSFGIGILITEYFANHLIRSFFAFSVFIELLLLIFINFYPYFFYDNVAIALIALVCSIQLGSFKKICGTPYSSTMCTGNLRSAMEALYYSVTTRQAVWRVQFYRYSAIIFCFIFGAVIGGLGANHWGRDSIVICTLLVAVIFIMILIDVLRNRNAT